MRRKINKQKGFTLIELMIVVGIIGVIVSIAIPQFSSFSVKANNATAQSDMRNLTSNMEIFFFFASEYPDPSSIRGASTLHLSNGGETIDLVISQNVDISFEAPNQNTRCMIGKHLHGDTIYYSNTDDMITRNFSANKADIGVDLAVATEYAAANNTACAI